VDRRADLVALARALGDPALDLVVLSEGNAAARQGDATLLVTASGSALPTTQDDEIVEVSLAPLLDFVRSPDQGTDMNAVKDLLVRACVRPGSPRPSIETLMHAVVLDRTDATFIGHTHPTPLVGLLCAPEAGRRFERPLFPDEAVVCGAAYAYVPYASPGLPLARAVEGVLEAFEERHGESPRAVLLENHGFMALGATPAEVRAVTTMAVKAARVRGVAAAAGGIETLSADEVRSLVDRPDEKLRRSRLVAGES
jgi:rhamnose utilization protein RhaD (predicted bifunctional aldolase and dehydrogenase)